MISAWLGGPEWADRLLPFLVSTVSASLYATGYMGLRTRPPIPLNKLKLVDTLLVGGAIAGAWLLTRSPIACMGLLVSAWLDNWLHEAPFQRSGEGAIPPPPTFLSPVIGPVTAGYRSYDRSHTGVDIGVPQGTPLMAPADGIVVQAGPLGQWGFAVTLRHEGGWSTFFAHLSRVCLKRHSRVSAGTCIAWSGSSGVSTGPHVHVELRYNGVVVDPGPLVSKD